ncbi:MAG: DUF7385 family protein [Halodesulfurarchaeum sp.]
MDVLEVDDGFSVHDYRSGLKLLRQDSDAMTLENRQEFACPACGKEFGRLLVADDRYLTFSRAPSDPICVIRTDEQLLVLTH